MFVRCEKVPALPIASRLVAGEQGGVDCNGMMDEGTPEEVRARGIRRSEYFFVWAKYVPLRKVL